MSFLKDYKLIRFYHSDVKQSIYAFLTKDRTPSRGAISLYEHNAEVVGFLEKELVLILKEGQWQEIKSLSEVPAKDHDFYVLWEGDLIKEEEVTVKDFFIPPEESLPIWTVINQIREYKHLFTEPYIVNKDGLKIASDHVAEALAMYFHCGGTIEDLPSVLNKRLVRDLPHSSDPEYQSLSHDKMHEALRDRTVKIDLKWPSIKNIAYVCNAHRHHLELGNFVIYVAGSALKTSAIAAIEQEESGVFLVLSCGDRIHSDRARKCLR